MTRPADFPPPFSVSEAIGVAHPGLITAEDVDIFCGDYEARSLRAVYGYKDGWGSLGPRLAAEITELMAPGGSRPERRSIEAGEGEKEDESAFSGLTAEE